MNETPKNSPKTQPSILDFVDHLNYTTGKSREPRSLTKNCSSQQRASSSNSFYRKRKLSTSDQVNSSAKILVMESSNQPKNHPELNSSQLSHPQKPRDAYTTALLEMEMRLTQSMQDMIAPLKMSINSLVVSQQDWERQKSDVELLHTEKDQLNGIIKEVEAKNSKLENRVKKLEACLMENNLIIHGLWEGKWELDSTRNELVI